MSKELEELRGITRNKIEYIKRQPEIDWVYLRYYEGVLNLVNRIETIEKGKNTDIIDNYMSFKNDNVKPIEALEIVRKYESSNYLNVWHPKFVEDLKTVEKALLELKAIKKAEPSDALELVGYLKDLHMNAVPYYDWLNEIEQYILKAQEQEKDKVFLKNLHNTNVKVPLVNIFNGLSQEKRFAYTEHIYYHWEEMKKSLEAEIENIKTEKENLESKAKRQEKVLEIIKEKRINIDVFWNDFVDNGFVYNYYLERWYKYQSIDKTKLTEEEFELIRRYVSNEKEN